jgi:hypothetical protein
MAPSNFRWWIAIAAVALAAPASAAPPTLANLTPRGAERGRPVELLVTGANLAPQPRLLLPFKATQAALPDPKPNPAQARFQIVVDPSVPVGVYPVRVATDDGVSALALFRVDDLPAVAEVEDNNTPEKAQKVAPPVVVDGQCAGGDVDYFRFTAKKGQRLVIEAESARLGSGVLPQLRVTDDHQRLVAADDSQALQGDGRVVFTAPGDGDYLVEMSDTRYRGGNPPHYRLKIADYDVIDEVFPLGGRRGAATAFSLSGAGLPADVQLVRALDDGLFAGTAPLALDGGPRPGLSPPRLAVGDLPERVWHKPAGPEPRALDVLPPLTINSRLDKPGDVDRFQFAVAPGARYRITVDAEKLGSRLDAVLRVADQAGKQLALVDDVDLPGAGPGQPPLRTADPALDFTAPPGVSLLALEVRDQRGRGGVNFGYRLTIEPAEPDFVVALPAGELNVPRGGSAVLTVPVTRRGYAGPLQVVAVGLPPGLSAQGGNVPAGGTAAVLTITASESAALTESVTFALEGRADDGGRALRRTAEFRLIVSREANPAAGMLTLRNAALALTTAEPFAVAGPPAVEAVKGYATTVAVRLTRAKDQAALAIQANGADPRTAAGQPGAFTFQPAAATAEETAAFTLTPTTAAPEGTQNVIVEAKAKVGGADRTVVGPAVTVTVRRPFDVQWADASLTLTPGQTMPLRGKIVRQPVFKEAVQLKLDGLPAGVTLAAPPAPVPADRSDFQIDLKVDPSAPISTATLTLTASTTLAGAPYAPPPVALPAAVKK